MMAKTHFIAGAMAGFYVSQDLKGFIIGGIAGLIPDIDEPKSMLGRLVPFISYPLNKAIDHRTATHSLLFIVFGFLLSYFYLPTVAFIICAGLASHLLGDMLTGKIKLLWPSSISVGIPIPESLYRTVDFVIRLVLLSVCCWYGYNQANSLFLQWF